MGSKSSAKHNSQLLGSSTGNDEYRAEIRISRMIMGAIFTTNDDVKNARIEEGIPQTL